MTWSPSPIAASEPTIDASAPSARCVWPRMTPGWSRKVRFTCSSNWRMRAIWWKPHPSRSPSRASFAFTRSPFVERLGGCRRRAELGGGRIVRPPEDHVDLVVAQLLREDLDTPRARVAVVDRGIDVAADVELALAGEVAVVDDLVDVVVVGDPLELAVAELDPAEVLERDLAEVVRGDAELRHVPRVDDQAAVLRAGLRDEVDRRVQVVHVDVERHELV